MALPFMVYFNEFNGSVVQCLFVADAEQERRGHTFQWPVPKISSGHLLGELDDE